MSLEMGNSEYVQLQKQLLGHYDPQELIAILSMRASKVDLDDTYPLTYVQNDLLHTLQGKDHPSIEEILPAGEDHEVNKRIVITKGEKCTIFIDAIPCTISLDQQGVLAFEYGQEHIEIQRALVGKTSAKIFLANTLPFLTTQAQKKQLATLNEIKTKGIPIKNIASVCLSATTITFVYRYVDQGSSSTTYDYLITFPLTKLKKLLDAMHALPYDTTGEVELWMKDYTEIVAYFLDLSDTELGTSYKEFIAQDLKSVKLRVEKNPLKRN